MSEKNGTGMENMWFVLGAILTGAPYCGPEVWKENCPDVF